MHAFPYLITSTIISGNLPSAAESHPPFRCYWSDDVIGAEIGGAVKNVYAIAAGIVAGKKLGASAHAALVTRGFAEMLRFGAAFGARRETLTGLSGLGDLVLTCSSELSRNRTVGFGLGQGKLLDAIQKELGQVAEGVRNARTVRELALRLSVEMPITDMVYRVLHEGRPAQAAVTDLMMRETKSEMV